MLLTNTWSIREVIAFPTLRPLPWQVENQQQFVRSQTKETSKPAKKADLPSRAAAEELLTKHIQNEKLRHHAQMVAQAMEAYARTLGEDSELWYQAGLLHDLDWEEFPDEHPNKALTEWLSEYPQVLKDAIAAHAPDRTGKQPETRIERYLFACDELSGFLHAYSLMRPQGFAGMKASSVTKKLKDVSFAGGVNRDDVARGFALIDTEPSEHISFLIEVFGK
ncbi:HDIG domain-containing protein [Candidatus Woesebacteria bacterium]|nr:HDIG domain-containing protein [Candidatus Woesebacteria bacterium]